MKKKLGVATTAAILARSLAVAPVYAESCAAGFAQSNTGPLPYDNGGPGVNDRSVPNTATQTGAGGVAGGGIATGFVSNAQNQCD